MNLHARLFPLGEESKRLVTSVRQLAPVRSARHAVDIDEPTFTALLEAGDRTDGFWVSGEVVFTPAEVRTLTHFELVSRAVVRETRLDFERNDAVRARSPLIDAGAERPVRLVSSLYMTRIPLKPNGVGTIGDWTAEYVVGTGVAQRLTAERFSGLTLISILETGTGRPHSHVRQLYCESLLAPAVIDASVERIVSAVPEEDGHLRHLGCLSYAAADLRDRPDFNRTAEPWSGWHGWPSWVVGVRVKQTFVAAKCRGWAFRPVLTRESAIYNDYVAGWQRLRTLVGATSRSVFDGGRW